MSKRKDDAGAIARMVTAYNHDISSKKRPALIDELGTVEHAVYDWFSIHKSEDYTEDPTAMKLRELLNDIQGEHLRLVTRSVNKGDADPPVANFGSLDEKTQTRVRQLWSDLLNGTGNILITETQDYKSTVDESDQQVDHEGFRMKVLAAFARLLSGEFGRQLVSEANQNTGGQKTITIRPGLSKKEGDIPAEELLASTKDGDKASLEELDLNQWFGNLKKGSKNWNKKNKQLKKYFPEIQLNQQMSETARLKTMHELRPVKVTGGEFSMGFRVKIGNVFRYYRFGSGASSEIVMPSDLGDTGNLAMSRFIDQDENEILVPVFISLGHELGHAIHNIHGASSGPAQSLEDVAGHGINTRDYSGTLEEVVTIRGVENSLRKEHGLSGRHSHHNVLSTQSRKISDGPLDDFYNRIQLLPPNLRGPFNEKYKEINSLVGDRKNKQALREIAKVQKKITEALKALEEDSDEEDDAPVEENRGNFLSKLSSYFNW